MSLALTLEITNMKSGRSVPTTQPLLVTQQTIESALETFMNGSSSAPKHYFFLFFCSSLPHLLTLTFPCPSLDVTRIRSHFAGPFPRSRLRCAPILSREDSSYLFPRRLASICASTPAPPPKPAAGESPPFRHARRMTFQRQTRTLKRVRTAFGYLKAGKWTRSTVG